jgi:hypothetical protein
MNYLGSVLGHSASILLSASCLLALGQSLWAQTRHGNRRSPAATPLKILNSNRERDGLRGPVRRLRTEVAKVNFEMNGAVEGERTLLELTVYDVGGKRIDNKTFPVVNTPLGLETYDYDEAGRLLRTTVRNERGVVLSRTEYSYEYDAAGNWVKMTSSLVVSESGRERLEPFEVAYRTIIYYSGSDAGAAAGGGEGRTVNPAVVGTRQDPLPTVERVASSAKAVTSPTSSSAGEYATSEPEKESSQMGRDISASTAVDVARLTDVGLINDKALSLPGPAYPINWRKAVTPITVTVEVVIDETGRVIYSRAVEGPRELWRVAEDAARRAGFLPFRAERRPHKVKGLLSYSFPFDPR